MDGTLVVAIVGLGTTAGTPLLLSVVNAKRETTSWRRNQKSDVYAEAMTFAQLLEASMERAQYGDDGYTGSRAYIPPPHPDLVTAKMRMYVPKAVFDAWLTVLAADEAIRWDWDQNPGVVYAPGDAVMVQGATAVRGLYRAVRKDLGT